jgi:hypothetical protein
MNLGDFKQMIPEGNSLEGETNSVAWRLYEELSRQVDSVKVQYNLIEGLLEEMKNVRLRLHFSDKSVEELKEAQNSFVNTVNSILGFDAVFMVVSLMDISHKVYIPPSSSLDVPLNSLNNSQQLAHDISQLNTIVSYMSAAKIDQIKPKLKAISQLCPANSRTYCLKIREDIGSDYSDLYLFCSYSAGSGYHSLITE